MHLDECICTKPTRNDSLIRNLCHITAFAIPSFTRTVLARSARLRFSVRLPWYRPCSFLMSCHGDGMRFFCLLFGGFVLVFVVCFLLFFCWCFLISWGAIIAGLFFVITASWLLFLLGSAIGVSIADASDMEAIGKGFGLGA